MHKIDGHALFKALNTLTLMDKIASTDPDWVYKGDKVEFMAQTITGLIEQLEILDTRLALNKARQMLLSVQESATQFAARVVADVVSKELGELRERLTEELEDRAIYHIPPSQAQLLSDAELSFGQEVVDCFPNMTTDLGEAAVCLGLSRNTACVFHLMRAVERAVIMIGERFEATIVNRNDEGLPWGVIISNVNGQIESITDVERKNAWAEISSLLSNVKNCWRNQTMHPKQTYTDDEAAEIFSAVKSFLRCLAEEWST